jgi:hypothetical protein
LINGIYYNASGGLLISKPGTSGTNIADQRRPLKYTHKQHQNRHLRTEKNYRRNSQVTKFVISIILEKVFDKDNTRIKDMERLPF